MQASSSDRDRKFLPKWNRVLVLLAAGWCGASGQTFSSGSTGADGALNMNQGGVVVFNPRAFNPPIDPEGDNIFHFTTINIASGTTVKLTARYLTGPVYFLASGAVTINGVLDLNGEVGHPQSTLVSVRRPSVPGAGGYPGGIGGRFVTDAQAGGGPAGGSSGVNDPHQDRRGGEGAGFMGNNFGVPLVGGSGGGGGAYNSNWQNPGYLIASGGGAGGGAILIASSVSITVNGRIWANGADAGTCCGCCGPFGGGGAGGTVRLVAPVLAGSGRIAAGWGAGSWRGGSHWGRVRMEAFQHQYTGDFYYEHGSRGHMPGGTVFRSSPSSLFLPTTKPPTIRVKSVAGLDLPDTAKGSFEVPDVAINSGVSVAVEIEATRIPVGTIPVLTIFSEEAADQVIQAPALSGSDSLSNSTLSVLFPPGYSRGFVRASWNMTP